MFSEHSSSCTNKFEKIKYSSFKKEGRISTDEYPRLNDEDDVK